MNPLARARHLLARRPWLYWVAVSALAVAAGWVAAGSASALDEARRSWGTPRDVVVAAVDIAPGDELAGRTTTRRIPVPLVPPRAVDDVADGARARQRITVGEVLTEPDVAATVGPRALIPAGWSAVPVAEAVPSGAPIGDPVRPVAGGVVLAAEALIVGHAGDAVIVAVPADEAPQVAMAAARGEVALLLEP
jgi:hypothetical protein